MPRLPTETLTALLDVRVHDASFDQVLERLVAIAKETLGADEVSTTFVQGDKPYTAAYTGQLALDADEMQYDRGYGPCIDAGLANSILIIEDVNTEERWPDYIKKVRESGVGSSMSVPIPAQIDAVGALNSYWRVPRKFTEEEIELASELAGYLAVAATNSFAFSEASSAAAQMRDAMESRAVIEQAKGVIMAQQGCDSEAAFDILRGISQGKNVKLREVAMNIVRQAVHG